MASSIVNTIVNTAIETAKTAGKSLLASKFPTDFEVYLCALELTDDKGNTIDYFTFPIQPDSISVTESKNTTVQQTAGGLSVLSSTAFVPKNITIRGNFGRQFKIMLQTGVTISGSAFSISAGKRALYQLMGKSNGLKTISIDPSGTVKNGFGCIKIMQSIIDKSNGVSDQTGKPFRLYFYNLALGESYMCIAPPNCLNFSQSMNSNMIWNYQLSLMGVAPLEAVQGAQNKTKKALSSGSIQKAVYDIANVIRNKL